MGEYLKKFTINFFSRYYKIINFKLRGNMRILIDLVKYYVMYFTLVTIISLPALPFLLGKSNRLECVRLEINYAQCRQAYAHLYGLFKEPSVSMTITGTTIKTYETSDEDSTSKRYKVFINTKTGSLELYDYGSDEDKAKQDKQRIDKFLAGEGEASSNLEASNGFWGEVGLIYVGCFYTIIGFWILLFLRQSFKRGY